MLEGFFVTIKSIKKLQVNLQKEAEYRWVCNGTYIDIYIQYIKTYNPMVPNWMFHRFVFFCRGAFLCGLGGEGKLIHLHLRVV